MEASNLIRNLSLHQRYWSIIVVLTQIDIVRTFKSGQGKIQKLTLMDKEGSKIYAIMFNEIIDKFHDILQTGKTFVFSNGQIKEINKLFHNVNDKFEIILNNTSNIQLSDTDNIDSPKINLSVIEDIKRNPNLPSDIILLVIKVPEIRMIYRHADKKKVVKRDLQVVDLRYLIKLSVEDNCSTAIFTLFDNEAEQIIGMTVTELEKIKASNIEDYNNIIKKSFEKEMTFLVKAQDKIYGNRTFRSFTVQSIKMDSDEVGELQHKRIKIEDI